MINEPPPFESLNIRIPIIIPIKGKGFVTQGVWVREYGPLTLGSLYTYFSTPYVPLKVLESASKAEGPILGAHTSNLIKGSRWVLPPLSNSWMLIIIQLYIALNRTPNVDCYWGGAVPKVHGTTKGQGDGRTALYTEQAAWRSRNVSLAISGLMQSLLYDRAQTAKQAVNPKPLNPKPLNP